jgi:hypothetical protein
MAAHDDDGGVMSLAHGNHTLADIDFDDPGIVADIHAVFDIIHQVAAELKRNKPSERQNV